VPATVQAVLAARIDRVPPEEKHLLQTAAGIGMEVAFTLLQAVAGRPEETLRLGLLHIQGAVVIFDASLFPSPPSTFTHTLTLHPKSATMALLRWWPPAACRSSGGGGCTRASSRPSKRSHPPGSQSRSTAWRTMPCGARCGRRPCPTATRRVPGPTTAPRSARQ